MLQTLHVANTFPDAAAAPPVLRVATTPPVLRVGAAAEASFTDSVAGAAAPVEEDTRFTVSWAGAAAPPGVSLTGKSPKKSPVVWMRGVVDAGILKPPVLGLGACALWADILSFADDEEL